MAAAAVSGAFRKMTSYRYLSGCVPKPPARARRSPASACASAARRWPRSRTSPPAPSRCVRASLADDSARREQHVAALDVRDHVRKAVRLEARLQRGHLDQVVAADVDPAQQRDVPGHARGFYWMDDVVHVDDAAPVEVIRTVGVEEPLEREGFEPRPDTHDRDLDAEPAPDRQRVDDVAVIVRGRVEVLADGRVGCGSGTDADAGLR